MAQRGLLCREENWFFWSSLLFSWIWKKAGWGEFSYSRNDQTLITSKPAQMTGRERTQMYKTSKGIERQVVPERSKYSLLQFNTFLAWKEKNFTAMFCRSASLPWVQWAKRKGVAEAVVSLHQQLKHVHTQAFFVVSGGGVPAAEGEKKKLL